MQMGLTITKNQYQELLNGQKKLEREFRELKRVVITEIEPEIRPEVLRRLDRISKQMDKGKHGIVIRNHRELTKYIKGL